MSEEISLNCWVIGNKPMQQGVFQVQIAKSKTVRSLKYAIMGKREHGSQNDYPDSLVLWKVLIPFADLEPILGRIERPKNKDDSSGGMPSTDALSKHFPLPANEHVHVVVFIPHVHSESLSGPTVTKTTKWGIGIMTPVSIVAGMIGVAMVAVLHHFFDAYLDGRDIHGSFWTQTMTRRVENALATVFKILFAASAGLSLCQVAWHRVREVSFQLSDLDVLLSSPSWKTILRPKLLTQLPSVVAIIIAITASSLIPVFAPSLTVRPGVSFLRNIVVPCVNLATDRNLGGNTVPDFHFGSISESWDKAMLKGLLSDDGISWPMPQGCAPACHYNVTYMATALQCSDLSPNQISDGQLQGSINTPSRPDLQNPPVAILSFYDSAGVSTSVLNLTIQDDPLSGSDEYKLILAYVPFTINTTFDGKTYIPAYGSICTFYQATYEAHVSYSNSSQTNSVSVVEFHNPLNTTYLTMSNLFTNSPNPDSTEYFSPGVGQNVNFLSMASALTNHITGSIIRSAKDGDFHTEDDNGTAATETLIVKTGLFIMEEDDITDFSFSLNTAGGVTNLSTSLTNLLANLTLNYMNLNLDNTTVQASFPSGSSVYSYNRRTLITTYGIAFLILAITTFLGLSALAANGVPSSNSFSQLLVTTRNPRLDSLAKGNCLGSQAAADKALQNVWLRFGEVDTPHGSDIPHAAFGIAGEEDIRRLRKGRIYS